MYQPPGEYQDPSHSCDFDIGCKRGIAGTLVEIMVKHNEEPIIKEANPKYVSTGTCDNSSSSTSSPALAGVHSDKVPVLVAVRGRCCSIICIFLITGVVECIFICLPC